LESSGTGTPLIESLYEHPHTVPKFLRLEFSNALFKVFAVEPNPHGIE